MCDNSHEVPAITITHPVETEVAPTPIVKAKTTNSAAIVPKVASATLGGAVATLVVSLLGYFNINVPTDLTAALTTIFAFVFGYLTPSE
jgi:protein-S-isoprenylcysteine O-methyltransferase Ste14